MSAQFKDGGPAFPVPINPGCGFAGMGPADGMTLRDYFAAKCVAAMVSTIRCDGDYDRARRIAAYHGMASVSDWFAHDAYKQADAMLTAREVQS